MGIVASNASPILYRGGPRPAGGGGTTAYLTPSAIPGFRRRVIVHPPGRAPVSFPVILNRAVVAARQASMGRRRGLHGLGADNTLATGQQLINFCASLAPENAAAYPACAGQDLSKATGILPSAGSTFAGAQAAAANFTAADAPPIYQSTCTPSSNPSDWATQAYVACNNSMGAVSDVNDENARRYSAYQTAYANWVYGGQNGPPPPAPVYMTLDDYYSANPSIPGPPPGSIITAPAGTTLATSGGEYTGAFIPPGGGGGGTPAPANPSPGAPATGGGGSTATGNKQPSAGGPPGSGGTGASGTPQAVAITFQFTNSSRPGNPLQVGDSWTLVITGAANSPVTADAVQNGAAVGTGTSMGTTDASGKLQLSGSMDASTVGNWSETWHIGGQSAQLTFTVAPAPAGTGGGSGSPSPTGGGGSTATGTGLPPGASGTSSTSGCLVSFVPNETCIGPIGLWTGLAALVLVWFFFFSGKRR